MWRVPQDISNSCLLRISDADGLPVIPEQLSYEFMFKASRPQETQSIGQFTVHAGIPDPVTKQYRFSDISFISDAAADTARIYVNSAEVESIDLTAFVDKWQEIHLQFDLTNSLGSVWIDERPILERFPLNTRPMGDSFTTSTISCFSSAPIQIWIDDLDVRLQDKNARILAQGDAQILSKPLIWEGFNRFEVGSVAAEGGWADGCEAIPGEAGREVVSSLGASRENAELNESDEPGKEGRGFYIDGREFVSGPRSLRLESSLGPVQAGKLVSLPNKAPFGISEGTFAIVAGPADGERKSDEEATQKSRNDLRKRAGEREYVLRNRQLLIDTSQERMAAHPKAKATGSDSGAAEGEGVVKILSAAPAGSYYIYSYDGKLMAEYDMLGQLIRDYIYFGNQLIAEYQGGTTYYYYASDQVNSTRVVTDNSGVVKYSVAYDPYGGIQMTWGTPTYTPSLKFSGKERDQESDLDYFGARYFYAAHYRWLSPDPIVPVDVALGDPQAWNIYTYARNNPVNYIDPSGLYTFENGTPEQQAQFREALGTLANLIPYMADQYGKEGEENGVTVGFDSDADQPKTINNALNGQPRNSVLVPPELAGDELVIAIAHEGRHISTWRAWITALSLNDPGVLGADWINLTEYADEVKAYDTSVLAAKLLGKPDLIRSGFNIMRKRKLDMVSLNRLLAKSYGISPGSQGTRFDHPR